MRCESTSARGIRRHRKVKKMQLGAEPKATVNKKTAGIFLTLVALVAFAGIMGATLSNNADASRRKYGNWTNWDIERVLYFNFYRADNKARSGCGETMVFGDTSFIGNSKAKFKAGCMIEGGPVMSSEIESLVAEYGSNIPPSVNPMFFKYDKSSDYGLKGWNPVDQEYALGYIDFATPPIPKKDEKGKQIFNEYSGEKETDGMRWYCSARTVWPFWDYYKVIGSSGYSNPEIRRRFLPNGLTDRNDIGSAVDPQFKLSKRNLTTAGGNACTFKKDTAKSVLNYVDQINGAQYMGQLYDVRRYVWTDGSNGSDQVVKFVTGDGRKAGYVTGGGKNVYIHEFHFYPSGTLAKLDDELVYQTVDLVYEEEVTDKEGNTEIVQRTKRENAYVHRPKLIAGNSTYIDTTDPDFYGRYYPNTYLLETYELDDDPANPQNPDSCIYKLATAYRNNTNIDSNIICSSAEYQKWLRYREEQVEVLTVDSNGNSTTMKGFKGFVRADDIDEGGEGYVGLTGLKKVWLTRDTGLSIKTGTNFRNRRNSWIGDCLTALKDNPMHTCQYGWDGTLGCSADMDECAIYIAFESTPDEPFTFAYLPTGHASGLSSNMFTISYVIEGDIAASPNSEEILMAMAKFRQQYKSMYGKDISKNNIIKKFELNPDQVFRIITITQYGAYNPYTINKLLGGLDLVWYASENDLISDNPLPDDKEQIIYGDTVFYGSIDRTRILNFDPTCVSNNDEYIKTGEKPDTIQEDSE